MRIAVLVALSLTGCLGGGKSPVDGELPCTDGSVALYRVKGGRSGNLRVAVDTVAAESTFDPFVYVYEVTSWGEGVGGVALGLRLASGDDDFPCTFPPPAFECPQLTTALQGYDQDVVVVVEVLGECAGADAAYVLTVELDGEPAKLRLWATGDDGSLDVPTVQPIDSGGFDTGE